MSSLGMAHRTGLCAASNEPNLIQFRQASLCNNALQHTITPHPLTLLPGQTNYKHTLTGLVLYGTHLLICTSPWVGVCEALRDRSLKQGENKPVPLSSTH